MPGGDGDDLRRGPATCSGRWPPGRVGFLVKDGPVEGLADAIRRVAAGATVVDPELAGQALRTRASTR